MWGHYWIAPPNGGGGRATSDFVPGSPGREAPRPVRVNISIDAPLLAIIDATAERVNMTRSGLVEALARRHLAEFN